MKRKRKYLYRPQPRGVAPVDGVAHLVVAPTGRVIAEASSRASAVRIVAALNAQANRGSSRKLLKGVIGDPAVQEEL